MELEKWNINLSNYDSKIPVVISTISKLGTLWRDVNLEIKNEIPKIIFRQEFLGTRKTVIIELKSGMLYLTY